MVNDEINIPRGSSIRKHLEDFFKHYTNCLTKALKKTPALYVEVPTIRFSADVKLLFSKLPGTVYFLQHGEEAAVKPPSRPRAAAELEVRPGRSREDQIAVVVSTLLDDQKSEALDSMKTVIADAITEMRAWDMAVEARRIVNGVDNPALQSAKEPTGTFIIHLC
jgi:replication fork protection complex subunit Tof1/Swi1